jgi:hypothetical protein
VRSILLPRDETCLHLFEAASAETVVAACRAVGIRLDRLVEAVEIPAAPSAPTTPANHVRRSHEAP